MSNKPEILGLDGRNNLVDLTDYKANKILSRGVANVASSYREGALRFMREQQAHILKNNTPMHDRPGLESSEIVDLFEYKANRFFDRGIDHVASAHREGSLKFMREQQAWILKNSQEGSRPNLQLLSSENSLREPASGHVDGEVLVTGGYAEAANEIGRYHAERARIIRSESGVNHEKYCEDNV